MNDESDIIDMTDDENPLNGFTVEEADIRRFFWYLFDWSMRGQWALRVKQIEQDLGWSLVQVNEAFNILRDALIENRELVQEDTNWYYIGPYPAKRHVTPCGLCFYYTAKEHAPDKNPSIFTMLLQRESARPVPLA
jgi:hypothetical protein